jgi:hypothetical protein
LSPVRDDEMGTAQQQTPFQCDQCGATNIVAASVVYEQGTHSYSTRFSSGISQSMSAQATAPPSPRRYMKPLLLWGLGIVFSVFWGSAGIRAIFRNPQSHGAVDGPIAFLVGLGLICFLGMVLSFRKISRYNREVYPRLHWNWEHTYICRRCGRSQTILS